MRMSTAMTAAIGMLMGNANTQNIGTFETTRTRSKARIGAKDGMKVAKKRANRVRNKAARQARKRA